MAPFPNRLFLSQTALESAVDSERLVLEGETLHLFPEDLKFSTTPAVRFLRELTGEGDERNWVGRVKPVDELKASGADVVEDSVVLGDRAYEVEAGFLAAPLQAVGATSQASHSATNPSPANSGEDLDLLKRFLLGEK